MHEDHLVCTIKLRVTHLRTPKITNVMQGITSTFNLVNSFMNQKNTKHRMCRWNTLEHRTLPVNTQCIECSHS